MKYIKNLTLLFIFTAMLFGCQHPNSQQPLTYTDALFDTIINVRIFNTTDTSILNGCKEICEKYDTMFSRTNKESDIYKINHSNGDAVEVSTETIEIIKQGLYYSDLSQGAFDITIGTVTSLWDFKSGEHIIPHKDSICSAVSHINYKNVIIENNTIRLKDPKAMLDVGALAKGYIADCLKNYLLSNNITNAIIDLGGNIQLIGSKTDGTNYNIGIQKPFDDTGEAITSIKISDKSLVTTGIYQRYFEKDNIIYHHILNPNTGYPCKNDLYSVTIVTESSLKADALSTTCFLLGYDEGMELVNQLEDVDAIFITDDMEIHYSDNFSK